MKLRNDKGELYDPGSQIDVFAMRLSVFAHLAERAVMHLRPGEDEVDTRQHWKFRTERCAGIAEDIAYGLLELCDDLNELQQGIMAWTEDLEIQRKHLRVLEEEAARIAPASA